MGQMIGVIPPHLFIGHHVSPHRFIRHLSAILWRSIPKRVLRQSRKDETGQKPKEQGQLALARRGPYGVAEEHGGAENCGGPVESTHGLSGGFAR